MKNLLKKISFNWKSALTVALINIPLSLALAIASGATPVQGIITAFWAGALGALFGGSHFNIIGPTGALSGVLISYAFIHGYQSLPIIALISGVLILISYILRIDKYIIFIPQSVVHGFTLGVAFIIAFGQLDNALGLTNIPKTEHLIQNIWISLQHFSQIQWPIFSIFLASTIFIVLWNKKFPKFPGAIIMALFGILLTTIVKNFNLPLNLVTLGDKYPSIKATLFENVFSGLNWELFLDKGLWMIAIATAIIAILETLMSGQIAESITGVKFNRSKEVLGLSIANLGSGAFGGIPATAALARTALNIKSGATDRTSAFINSIIVGLIALFLFNYFKLLPTVMIASILTVVALGMIGKKHFIHLIENEKIAFVLSIFVALITVVEDPIVGILVGTFIALLIFVSKVSDGQTEILLFENGKMKESLLKNEFMKKDVIHSDVIVYKISGTLTYINMPAHLKAIDKIKNNNYVIISLRHAFYADSDGISYLKEIIDLLKKENKNIILCGINKEIKKIIEKQDFYKEKLKSGKIYTRTSEAINDINSKKI